MATATSRRTSIVTMLKEDHERFRNLFNQFEQGGHSRKQEIAEEFIPLIMIHDQVEKKLLYPYAADVSPEAEDIVQNGSHEFKVWKAVKAAGTIAIKDLPVRILSGSAVRG